MSAWALAARTMLQAGGAMTAIQLDNAYPVGEPAHRILERMRVLGLAASDGRGTWRLTWLGEAYAAGRIRATREHKRLVFVATWLAALPRDVQRWGWQGAANGGDATAEVSNAARLASAAAPAVQRRVRVAVCDVGPDRRDAAGRVLHQPGAAPSAGGAGGAAAISSEQPRR